MKLRFSGTRALVLGGSCELGLALASAMVPAGIVPLLTYRSKTGRQRIEAQLDRSRGAFETLRFDFAADDACADICRHLEAGVDYLVDLAQEDMEALVASADPGAAGRFFQANIAVRSEVIRCVARKMVSARRGRMVFISSTAAARANPGQGFYAAAKQAGEALYRNVGLELAGRGVTTATLRPGYVDAGRGRRYLQAQPRRIADKVPLGRALDVEEVVAAVMFLLSDSAAGINATAVTMDGGLTAAK